MKCICIILIVSLGLLNVKSEDEVTELSMTEVSVDSEKNINSLDSSKNFDDEMPEEQNELEKRLPSDYQSIRSKITDSKFECKEHEPGYYADIENDCQIFHRCLEGQDETYSFICPSQTVFSQRTLVCVWKQTRDLDCSASEDYYEESNRAFSGNITAEMNIEENRKNSTEITEDMEIEDIEATRNDAMSQNIKFIEIAGNHELESTNEDSSSSMVEKNSIEEKVETVKEETEEFNEFQAELIPTRFDGPDASIASSYVVSNSASHPQKISISILDPIIELPTRDEDQLQMTVEPSRNIRKRSGNHRSRFLFKADAH